MGDFNVQVPRIYNLCGIAKKENMFGNIYENKKVLITGNTGFKGSWLTCWLLDMGAKIFGVSKDVPTEISLFNVLGLKEKITHYEADMLDLELMTDIISEIKPDFIFHLAAQPIVKMAYLQPVKTMMANIIGTTHVLETVRTANFPCVMVMATSDKCYDNMEWPYGYRETDTLGGKDPYSASKAGAELMIKTYFHTYFNKEESGVRIASVRAGNVIGGGDWAADRIVPDCVRAWSEGRAVEVRSPRAMRPWQHVLEPLSGYLRIGQLLSEKPGLSGEAFNFGPGASENNTVLALLAALSQHWDFENDTSRFTLREDPNFSEAGLLKLNCDKALQLLKWQPVLDFEKTAAMTGAWYNRFYNHSGTDFEEYTQAQIHEYCELAAEKNIVWDE